MRLKHFDEGFSLVLKAKNTFTLCGKFCSFAGLLFGSCGFSGRFSWVFFTILMLL
jgi:hypothetical protein